MGRKVLQLISGLMHRTRRRGGIPLSYPGTVAIIVHLQFEIFTAEAQRWMVQMPFAGLARSWSGSAWQVGRWDCPTRGAGHSRTDADGDRPAVR
jgi:hypothetical protein